MNDPAYYLSDKDRQDFLAMRDEWRRRTNGGGQGFHRKDHTADQTPDVFLARTPAGGIPATDVNGTGTTDDEVFGSATCTIYRLSISGSGTGTADDDNLIEGVDQTRRVFNPSAEEIPADTWIIVSRDKFGVWWVVEVGAGDDGSYEKGRWAYVTSATPNGYGYWPALLINKDVDGNRTLGDEIRVKLLPYSGDEYIRGVYWVTFLRMINEDDDGTGTGTGQYDGTGTATTEFALYDGKGNDIYTFAVCRNNATEYDQLSIPHPISLSTNVGSGTA